VGTVAFRRSGKLDYPYRGALNRRRSVDARDKNGNTPLLGQCLIATAMAKWIQIFASQVPDRI